MRTKRTCQRQKKLIDARVGSMRKAMEGNAFGFLFNADAQTEMIYLMGAAHGIQYAMNEQVYEPATFAVTEGKKVHSS